MRIRIRTPEAFFGYPEMKSRPSVLVSVGSCEAAEGRDEKTEKKAINGGAGQLWKR